MALPLTARIWSNDELKKFAPECRGKVLNVSAWQDEDKQGNFYRNYFSGAESYEITNYQGERGLQFSEQELDLLDIPEEMVGGYDAVFNHTTLEHIFDVRTAFKNLCRLSRDKVIIVVPKSQETHVTGSYGDYWRFTELSIKEMFKENGFDVEHISEGGSLTGIYLFCIGKKVCKKSTP